MQNLRHEYEFHWHVNEPVYKAYFYIKGFASRKRNCQEIFQFFNVVLGRTCSLNVFNGSIIMRSPSKTYTILLTTKQYHEIRNLSHLIFRVVTNYSKQV